MGVCTPNFWQTTAVARLWERKGDMLADLLQRSGSFEKLTQAKDKKLVWSEAIVIVIDTDTKMRMSTAESQKSSATSAYISLRVLFNFRGILPGRLEPASICFIPRPVVYSGNTGHGESQSSQVPRSAGIDLGLVRGSDKGRASCSRKGRYQMKLGL